MDAYRQPLSWLSLLIASVGLGIGCSSGIVSSTSPTCRQDASDPGCVAGVPNTNLVVGAINRINACQTISQPGNYVLTSDVSKSGSTCFKIISNDVTLDGKNPDTGVIHKLTVSGSNAVLVGESNSNISRVTVTNVITNGSFGEDGNTNDLTIENSTFTGLSIHGSDNVVIRNNSIGKNPFTGAITRSMVLTIWDAAEDPAPATCGSQDPPKGIQILNNKIFGEIDEIRPDPNVPGREIIPANKIVQLSGGCVFPTSFHYAHIGGKIIGNEIRVTKPLCVSTCRYDEPTAFRLRGYAGVEIDGNTVMADGAAGLYFRDTTHNTVKNNNVYVVNSWAGFFCGSGGEGINDADPSNFVVTDNLVVNSGGPGIFIQALGAGSNTFEKNIFWGHDWDGNTIAVGEGNSFTHNTFYNSLDFTPGPNDSDSHVIDVREGSGTITFSRNIISQIGNDDLFRFGNIYNHYSGNHNIFYSTASASGSLFFGDTLSTWRTKTQADANSEIRNPMFQNTPVLISNPFADPDLTERIRQLRNYFRLQTSSPACSFNGDYVGAYSCSAEDTLPNPPSNLRVDAISSSHARLSWTAPAGAAELSYYNVYRNGTRVSSAAKDSTAYEEEGLTPGATYVYHVTSVAPGAVPSEKRESVPSASVSITLPNLPDQIPPQAPQRLENWMIGPDDLEPSQQKVLVAWRRNTSLDIDRFILRWRQGECVEGEVLGDLDTQSISWQSAVYLIWVTIHRLEPSQMYCAQVRTIDKAGNVSEPSNLLPIQTRAPGTGFGLLTNADGIPEQAYVDFGYPRDSLETSLQSSELSLEGSGSQVSSSFAGCAASSVSNFILFGIGIFGIALQRKLVLGT